MTEFEHHHDHNESCPCGCYNHELEHVHSHDVDGIHIEHHIHDGACVASGSVSIIGVYENIRPIIKAELESIASTVASLGGIVGHIKASAEIKHTEMFSVTETNAMVKCATTQDITVRIAAIVFSISSNDIEPLVESALRAVQES